jgi:hypothetical protein
MYKEDLEKLRRELESLITDFRGGRSRPYSAELQYSPLPEPVLERTD